MGEPGREAEGSYVPFPLTSVTSSTDESDAAGDVEREMVVISKGTREGVTLHMYKKLC
jgi:hypothetical protein